MIFGPNTSEGSLPLHYISEETIILELLFWIQVL